MMKNQTIQTIRVNFSIMKTQAIDLVNNIGIAFGVALSTVLSGILTTFDIFSNHAGAIASLVGVVLSLVLIAVNIRNFKKAGLELELLQRRKDDRDKLADKIEKKSPN